MWSMVPIVFQMNSHALCPGELIGKIYKNTMMILKNLLKKPTDQTPPIQASHKAGAAILSKQEPCFVKI